MLFKHLHIPEKPIQIQKPMLRVCYALAPLLICSLYLFGWRSLLLTGIVLVFGTATEAIFAFKQEKAVTSAVFVTCLIFSLSLPPTTPFWMAVIGIVAGVGLGKMVFGGFGQNIFNPAMVGRCFIYVTFPIHLTNRWIDPLQGGAVGLLHWSPAADALTQATPLVLLRDGEVLPFQQLLLGNTAGSLGETSALLILLGGAYIIYKKAAPWRIAASCVIGGMVLSGILHGAGVKGVPSVLYTLLSGSFLFGTAFVATEPISGAKTQAGQWIYGFVIGGLTVVLRGFSNFSEGVMFSVLLMNAFVPVLDRAVRQVKSFRRVTQ